MTLVIELPSKIDHAAVEQLMEQLKANSGKAVHVDTIDSKGIGGLASQVLLAALRKWRSDDVAFKVTTSETVEADLQRLGLLDEFQSGEQET